jgi:hypothetical protein
MKHPIKALISASTIVLVAIASSCNFSGDPISEELKAEYMSIGQGAVQNAAGTLMGNLVAALDSGGVESAVPFCKANADSILASLSSQDGIKKVRRTTNKYRNKANKASERDKNIIKVYEYATNRGDSIKPILQLDPKNQQVLYYSPIYIQPTCLKCHGNQDNGYSRENFDIVDKLYPKDKAFNYSLGDFRGMWVIHLNERAEPQN